jgi:aconitate hydratase
MSKNSFGSQTSLSVGSTSFTIYRLDAVEKLIPQASKLPFALKVLLENLLRTEDGISVLKTDIEALAKWDAKAEPDKEIAFTPSRVLYKTLPAYRPWSILRRCVMP